MKKKFPAKKSSKSSQRKKTLSEAVSLPGLVEAMAKLVERLEILERKNDQVISRISSLPSEIRSLIQNFDRKETQAPTSIRTQPQEGRRERVMYQTICADCCKNCEVPFKPTPERPVYCKECFAIRKAGHVPTDPTQRIAPVTPQKKIFTPAPMDYNPDQNLRPKSSAATLKRQKTNSKKKKK